MPFRLCADTADRQSEFPRFRTVRLTNGRGQMPQTTRKANVAAQRRERAQALREERRREEVRRRRRMVTAIITSVVVLLGVLVTVGVLTHKKPGSGHVRTPVASSVFAAATGVPATVFDTVGKGSGATPPTSLNAAALTTNGKPELLYVGAEYCPYCAAQRWAMVTALSRFGTFKNLGAITSSPTDVFPNTNTFSFYGSSYSSPYLSFQSREIESNVAQGGGYTSLEKLSSAESTLFKSTGKSSFPFLDFGGKYVLNGPQYSPQVLQGKTMQQIATALSDPNSDIAKAVIGSANYMTAAICKMTNNQPANVCTSPTITSLQSQLK
jgi:hypothetical protein